MSTINQRVAITKQEKKLDNLLMLLNNPKIHKPMGEIYNTFFKTYKNFGLSIKGVELSVEKKKKILETKYKFDKITKDNFIVNEISDITLLPKSDCKYFREYIIKHKISVGDYLFKNILNNIIDKKLLSDNQLWINILNILQKSYDITTINNILGKKVNDKQPSMINMDLKQTKEFFLILKESIKTIYNYNIIFTYPYTRNIKDGVVIQSLQFDDKDNIELSLESKYKNVFLLVYLNQADEKIYIEKVYENCGEQSSNSVIISHDSEPEQLVVMNDSFIDIPKPGDIKYIDPIDYHTQLKVIEINGLEYLLGKSGNLYENIDRNNLVGWTDISKINESGEIDVFWGTEYLQKTD